MRIAQINCSYGFADSTGRNTKELHQWFLERGYDSRVYTARINDETVLCDERVHIFSSSMDMRIHGLLSRIIGKQGVFSFFSTRKLINALNTERPDAVIMGVLHSNCLNMPLLFDFLSKKRIPTVLVLHDCWYYTGHCCHYSEEKCNKWRRECGNCPAIHKWNKSWFFDWSKQNLQEKHRWYNQLSRLAVVGVSDWITNEAKQSILNNADIIQRIYNWIDLDTFHPQKENELRRKLGIKTTERVLLGVASIWNDRKGLREMCMVAELPDTKVVLVGEVPNDIRIPDNIICVGKVNQADILAQYYAMADVFLNPSIQETFGKTTAEALACGTPVVVYNTTACPELIGFKCGEIVAFRDQDSFVKTVESVLEHTEEYTNCREWAESMFSQEKNMREYEALIKRLVQ